MQESDVKHDSLGLNRWYVSLLTWNCIVESATGTDIDFKVELSWQNLATGWLKKTKILAVCGGGYFLSIYSSELRAVDRFFAQAAQR